MYSPPPSAQDQPSSLDTRHENYAHSCIPSVVPPGEDPASVDFRTFYPYVPNEVKHRKRTTRAQLKVLEDIFKDETKPNAALRKKLAGQLGMTPRGVQVWFQNRRAKEKMTAKKLAASKKGANVKREHSAPASPIDPESSPSSGADSDSVQSPHSSHGQLSPAAQSSENLCKPTSPQPTPSPTASVDSNLPWPSPAPESYIPCLPSPAIPHIDTEIINLRRGSLPASLLLGSGNTSPFEHGGQQSYPVDLLSRRRSVDMSLSRLAGHPYAHLAVSANTHLFGASNPHRIPGRSPSGPTIPGYLTDRQSMLHPNQRPGLMHRYSMPHALNHHAGYAPRGLRSQGPTSTDAHCVSSPRMSRVRSMDNQFLARSIPELPPGPLPDASFSFGSTPSESEISPGSAPDPEGCDVYEVLPMRQAVDVDTDGSSSACHSAYPYSRYGSMDSLASFAGSESSYSSFYSDVGSVGCVPDSVYDSELRRSSCGSNGFLDMFSGMDVGGSSGADPNSASASSSSLDLQLPTHPENSSEPLSYPSPGSTISPGDSPRVREAGAEFPISCSSELTYALEVKHEEAMKDPSMDGSKYSAGGEFRGGPCISPPQITFSHVPDSIYPLSAASSSTSSLGSFGLDQSGKYLIDSNIGPASMTGHYSPPEYEKSESYMGLPTPPSQISDMMGGVFGNYGSSANYSGYGLSDGQEFTELPPGPGPGYGRSSSGPFVSPFTGAAPNDGGGVMNMNPSALQYPSYP
ncbi:hypothetical protein JAAARDRAFT_47621 [Jaapia argillacea MUCL 33604]|uniref:Homeobox domain-containing protein n=1 Tax=Jaapia argillacea MUCL 33604 TaxID=933084 RepID=A0A067PVA2_9AGAM|nr:hypothetical protein JAAARDRAFT_47621 [Jaapia argillacea MUCL 33604]